MYTTRTILVNLFLFFCYTYCITFFPFQKTLNELFPSYKDVLKQEKVVVFTCGLMKDPTPVVNHVYELFLEYVYDRFSPRNEILSQGKDPCDLFRSIYREARIPLNRLPGYNHYIYWNDMHKGDIHTASKLYLFNAMNKDDVPDVKFTNGSDEAAECMLWIEKPDEDATKTLLATCCKISRRQQVNLLIMSHVHCEELTPEDTLTMSKSIQSVAVSDSDFPLNFWKHIFNQLLDCVNLRHLWLGNTNLHKLEEDLDELLENLDSRCPNKHPVDVQLTGKKFSKKFVKKWSQPCSAIECHFYDIFFHNSDSSDDEDDLNMDEINWLIESHSAKQPHPVGQIFLAKESITADLVTVIEMSDPFEQLVLRDCSISDDEVFEILFGSPVLNFLTALDLGGTKLGCNAGHIIWILTLGNLKELHLQHCEIPPLALEIILPALLSCKKFTHLNLAHNNLRASGLHVAESITAWGDDPTLKEINLGHCAMTREATMKLLSALGSCKSLMEAVLTGNVIQGCLNSFLPNPHEGLHSLGKLFLDSTSLNSEDMSHLVQLVEKKKLPMLEELDLGSNALHITEDMVEHLVEVCVTHHLMELKVNVCFNNFFGII